MARADATVEFRSTTPAQGHDSFAPRPAVVEAGPVKLSAETEALLRSRLRVVTGLLAVSFLIFFARWFLLPERDVPLMVFHATCVGVLALAFAVLLRRPLPLRHLRAIEVTVFGLSALFFAVFQYRMVLLRARQGNGVLVVATIKSAVIYMFALMSVYGTFIPNRWRRAAAVLAPMALTPSAVMALLAATHPGLRGFLLRYATFEQVSDNQLMLLLGAVTSVFATHIINNLRTDAFEARRLGQYQLGERLGSGGMGEVYLAEHQLMKRPCAVKLIRPDSAADPRFLARFEREVRTTARLSHPNTVEIYDYGRTDDGTFYYVMEYLPGMSLADLVDGHGPLPPERAIHLLRQVCQALHEAHEAGLTHRDIKPTNLFASQRGGVFDVAKVLDFGLVKQTSEAPSVRLSQEGVITGSPLYLSPEQASGDNAPDRRSDIYSVGAVAYFLLTGRPPFVCDNAIKLMIMHARDPVTPPSEIRPAIPADVEQVVLRCLEKGPAARYPDALSLDRALAGCQSAGLWTQEQAIDWWRTRGTASTATVELTQ
ncbi:MAG TPA: protein kinase [Isosphaeraceae bacterium]|jgi:serine/threonine-protein kinase|nr:protein kinase [Isosphaeraceae bacterium]